MNSLNESPAFQKRIWSFTALFLLFFYQMFPQSILMNATTETVCSGTFYDSGGAGANYGNGQTIVKVLVPSVAGNGVILNFTSFNTETYWDYLEIYDGPTTSSPHIGTFSGTQAPGIIAASNQNTGGELTLRFISNGGSTASGWQASISCGAKGTPYFAMNNQSVTTCSGIFTDSGGSLTNYGNSQTYIKTFYPSTAGLGISLTFTSFNIEQYFDRLEIYDGTSITAPLLANMTGVGTTGAISASSQNASGALTIRFISSGGTTMSGWSANISCVTKTSPALAAVSGTVNPSCGYQIYDSGGPLSDYAWNSSSTISYCPPAGQCVQLALSQVSVEPVGDTLRIYDGATISSPIMATYQNLNSVAGTFTASNINSTGCITLRFQEDGWHLYPGWAGTVTCVPCSTVQQIAISNGTINTCSANLSDSGGPFGNYPDSQNLIQTICSNDPALPYVKIDLSNFSSENIWDRLYVYNGTSTLSPVIANLTGNVASFWASSTDASGCLTLRFVSDWGTSLTGWTSTVSCIGTALPVRFVSLSAWKNNGNVEIEWITDVEKNADHFEVERSINAVDFSKMAEINASGESTSLKKYRITDNNPVLGNNYYRIKTVDKDGTWSHSKIVFVNVAESGVVKVYPNPFEDELNLELGEVSRGELTVDLINCIGEQIFSRNFSVTEQTQNVRVSLGNLAEGSYLCRTTLNGVVHYFKLIKV